MEGERRARIRDFFRIRNAHSLYFYAVLIGGLAGVFALLFSYCLGWAEHWVLGVGAGLKLSVPAGEHHFTGGPDRPFNPWILFILPAVGGLLTGLAGHFLKAQVRGAGTDDYIKAFHHHEGRIKGRMPFAKALASIFTLSTGGSGGKEGPTGLIGAGIGNWVAKALGAGARARRTLLLVGTAGGLGAIFRAPLGGAITAVEVVYKEDIESDSLIPCIISSVTGHLVYTSLAGSGSVFHVAEVRFENYRELVVYFFLALLCFSIGGFFATFFHKVRYFFDRLKIHPILKPALGGLGVGFIGLFFPEIIGTGFGLLQNILNGENPGGAFAQASPVHVAGIFLLIALLKILATSLTISSGGSGGVFGPSLFIGGMLGGFVGTLAQHFIPEANISVVSFVLVGMGSFFAGVAHAPIAGMIMVCDMIGSYKLLPPLMIVSILALMFSRHESIYRGQVKNRFQSPAHYWDMNLDVLDTMLVGRMFDEFRTKAIVAKNMLLSQLEELSLEIQATDFVIVNDDGSYHGILSLRRVRLTQQLEPIRGLVTLEDADITIPSVTPKSSLGDAFQIIMKHDVDKVAVENEGKVVGYLTHRDILKIYTEKVKRA